MKIEYPCRWLLACGALLVAAGPACAGPAALLPPDPPEITGDAAGAGPDPTPQDKCDQQPATEQLPEQVQSGVFEFACRTVRWFDGLFGDSRDFREESIQGKLSAGFAWNEYEGWEPSLRFRVRAELPNLSSRWNAFFGRVDEEDYISGTETTQESAFRRGVTDADDPEWLLGLGYQDRDDDSGWNHSVGVRLRAPPRLYVRSRYERNTRLTEHLDLRYRQTFFWRDGTGFGTTAHLDSAREFGLDNVLRWEFIGKITEETDGTAWWAANTWYHRLGPRRGISLRSFARGLTDGEVGMQEYGFELTWRRQVTREWLYINVGPTLTWPRERKTEKREASWGAALLLEMEFGYFRG